MQAAQVRGDQMKGKIKKYFEDKGYGYIEVYGLDDVLFRPSQDECMQVKVGAEVEFVYESQDNGKKIAKNLRFANTLKVQYYTPKDTAEVKYYAPKDTAVLLSSNSMNRENSALEIEKFIHVPVQTGKIAENKKERTFSQQEKMLLKKINDAQANVLGNSCYTVVGKLGSRMVVGLGSASVFETGIILHKPYGFPYIPGSSIKGATRSFLDSEYKGQFELDTLFGTQTNKGKLAFIDAYPVKIDKLELDIMNPHFPEWYAAGSNKAPTDDSSPIPINFYAVPAATKFTFHISGDVSEEFADAFKEMLRFAGLGAKTAVGYGWMEKTHDVRG